MLNPIHLYLTKLFQWSLEGKSDKFFDVATLSSSNGKGGERYLIPL
jgi:hypothetical protein